MFEPVGFGVSDMAVRRATVDDVDALFRVHRASVRALCSTAYSARHIDTWFEGRTPEIYLPILERGQILVALLEGRIQGFVGALPGEVTSLFVLPAAAGRGLGRALFLRGLGCAEASFDGPITVISTVNAVDFYARFGFQAVEEGTFVRGQGQLQYPVVKMLRGATERDNQVPASGDPPCV